MATRAISSAEEIKAASIIVINNPISMAKAIAFYKPQSIILAVSHN